MFGIRRHLLLDKAGDGGDGGAGADPKDKADPIDYKKQFEELSAKNKELADQIAKLSAKDKDLLDKAKDQQNEKDRNHIDSKALEQALTFSLKSEAFLKENESLLPKDVKDIFKIAEKETYNDAVEKASAIKSGIIQSFFSIQANMDLLTDSQKSSLEDYLKLTKTGKQDKAQNMYDQVFEPTFQMLKRIKKAEVMSKGGANHTDAEQAYKKKLMDGSSKHYLGDKK